MYFFVKTNPLARWGNARAYLVSSIEPALRYTYSSASQRAKNPYLVGGIPKLPYDFEDATKLALDREKYAAFMLSVLYPGLLDLSQVEDSLWSFYSNWIKSAPDSKCKFVANCEAIRNDNRQYGIKLGRNRITKAEHDHIANFLEGETGDILDMDGTDTNSLTLEVMERLIEKLRRYGPLAPTSQGREIARFEEDGIKPLECKLKEPVPVFVRNGASCAIKFDEARRDSWETTLRKYLNSDVSDVEHEQTSANEVYRRQMTEIEANTGVELARPVVSAYRPVMIGPAPRA